MPAVISQAQAGSKMVGLPIPQTSVSATERADTSTDKAVGFAAAKKKPKKGETAPTGEEDGD